jgi:hypothetical protein
MANDDLANRLRAEYAKAKGAADQKVDAERLAQEKIEADRQRTRQLAERVMVDVVAPDVATFANTFDVTKGDVQPVDDLTFGCRCFKDFPAGRRFGIAVDAIAVLHRDVVQLTATIERRQGNTTRRETVGDDFILDSGQKFPAARKWLEESLVACATALVDFEAGR